MGNRFAEILSCKNKGSLERLCKITTVAKKEFVDFIIACKHGATDLNHVMGSSFKLHLSFNDPLRGKT